MEENTVSNYVNNELLYNEFFAPLFRYIFFRTRDYEVANDLTQTSFLKFLNQHYEITDKEYAIKLLFTIARNTLIDYWRTENKRKHQNIEEAGDIQSEMPNAEELMIIEQDKQFINESMKDLSEIEKEIISMRLSGDISYENIAKLLGISITNARKIYSRAIQKVGVILKNNNQF